MEFKSILKCLLIFPFIFSHTSIALNNSPLHTWASLEYLYWWSQNSPIGVPLITKNNNPAALGAINESGTKIIFGSGCDKNNFNFGGMSGARIVLGSWLDHSDRLGIEASGFGLEKSQSTFSASSVNGKIPVINIPFFDVLNSTENALVANHPNRISVSDNFQPWGIELNGLFNLSNQLHFPFIILSGFRYINLNEDFSLNDAIYELPAFPNSVINLKDNFSTENNFFGVQLGGRTRFDFGKFMCDLTGLLALGENFEKQNISGQLNVDNSRVIQSFGLFSEPSNIGSHQQNQFAVIPEFRTKISYSLHPNIHPFFTYNVFYINNIIRPGEQIDRNINKSQNPSLGGTGVLSSPAVPSTQFNNSSMWMQGVSAGIEFVFN